MTEPKLFYGLLRRRQVWLPTWRAWLALLAIGVTFLLTLGKQAYSFLAVNDPLTNGVLVVEGWLADYGKLQAVAEFNRHPCQKVFVTGGPLEIGIVLSEYKNYAALGAASLIRLGLPTNVVQAVPTPWVCKDRTYASAQALKQWFAQNQIAEPRVNLITAGAHARRSRLLFEKGLGPNAYVGVIAIEPRDYDTEHWWRYSGTVRAVINEMIAYIYARFLFRPPE